MINCLDPVEDKTFGGPALYIDLTPTKLWGAQGKQLVGDKIWAEIEALVARRVGYTCELCQASTKTAGLMGRKAHKFCTELRFEHNDVTRVARLRRLMFVCVGCSQSIHLRQTQLISEYMTPPRTPYTGATARLEKLSGFSELEISRELDRQLTLGLGREQQGYPVNIDFSILEEEGARLWT